LANQRDALGRALNLGPSVTENTAAFRSYILKLMFLRQLESPRRQSLGLLVFSNEKQEERGMTPCNRDLLGRAPIRGCHHSCHSLARDIGAPQGPRVAARESKRRLDDAATRGVGWVVEKLERCGEMLLDAREVATTPARPYLERMKRSDSGGIANAKGELKSLVG
jgi:hypothetical protein